MGAGLALTIGAMALPAVAGAEFDAGVLIEEHYAGDPWVGLHARVIGGEDGWTSGDFVTADSHSMSGAHARNGIAPNAHHDW